MKAADSYRQILRSSSIIGGASAINILVGVVRTKVAAVLLGPAGIGLIGLLSNLMATAAAVAAVGSSVVGTRQIAAAVATADEDAISLSRRALFWGTLALALFGSGLFWLFRFELATFLLADSSLTASVAWLAIGVGLSVAAGSQTALLNGMRRIGDLARVSVLSGLLATLLGIPALLYWGRDGLLAYLLLTPISSFVVGYWYAAKLPRPRQTQFRFKQVLQECVALGRLGLPVMVAGLVMLAGQLAVRSRVQRELGVDALGHFEAAWVISMTYAGLVLRAMGTDFYPRLTAIVKDPVAANRLVNEQSEAALLLAAPVLLAMIGLAPWVVGLLYSSEFAESALILQWQIVGDIFKVACFPLGYIILAAGEGRTFLLSDTASIGVFVLAVWIGLPILGIRATGVAFLLMYMVNLAIVFSLARRRSSFKWRGSVWKLFVAMLLAAGIISVAAFMHPLFGAASAVLLSAAFAMMALVRFGREATSAESTGAARTVHRIARRFSWGGK